MTREPWLNEHTSAVISISLAPRLTLSNCLGQAGRSPKPSLALDPRDLVAHGRTPADFPPFTRQAPHPPATRADPRACLAGRQEGEGAQRNVPAAPQPRCRRSGTPAHFLASTNSSFSSVRIVKNQGLTSHPAFSSGPRTRRRPRAPSYLSELGSLGLWITPPQAPLLWHPSRWKVSFSW